MSATGDKPLARFRVFLCKGHLNKPSYIHKEVAMGMARAVLTSGLMLLAGSAMFAGTQDTLFQSVKKQWPDKKEGVIVCNTDASAAAVQSLAAAASKLGIALCVCNVGNERDVDAAIGMVNRSHPDFLVLVDQDPVLGASSKSTKRFIDRAASAGVPTIATGEALVKIGAVLSPEGKGKS